MVEGQKNGEGFLIFHIAACWETSVCNICSIIYFTNNPTSHNVKVNGALCGNSQYSSVIVYNFFKPLL